MKNILLRVELLLEITDELELELRCGESGQDDNTKAWSTLTQLIKDQKAKILAAEIDDIEPATGHIH